MSIELQSSKAQDKTVIEYEDLAREHYGNSFGDDFAKKLNAEFTVFLRNRTVLAHAVMQLLVNGERPGLYGLWASYAEDHAGEAISS